MLTLPLALLTLQVATAGGPKKPLFPPRELDVTEVALGTSIGVMWIDLGAWNDTFAAQGQPRLGPVAITPLAVNGELWANRHVPGFDYISYQNVGGEPASGGVTTQLRYSLTELSYGLAVVHKNGWSLVPKVGVGVADMEINVQPTGGVDFSQALADPGQSLTLQKTQFVGDLSLGVSFLASIGPRDKLGINTGFRFTLRVGGLFQLFETNGGDRRWQSHGEPISNAPGLYLGGPYARFIIIPSLLHRSKYTPKPTKSGALDLPPDPEAP